MKTYHIIVSGNVQGVFYRVTARDKAKECSLTGWVKNTDNGDVEIMATGEEENLQQFIEWCRTGPSKAKVDNVVANVVATTNFRSFAVVR